MIESVNNEKVKFFKKLREKKYIIENNLYIVEGEHLVEEAYKAGLLEEIITSKEKCSYSVKTTFVSERVMESISKLPSAPKIMGVVKLVSNKEIKGKKIILLDNVQDPGNVGTIIRSALAFNVDTVVLSPDSVNLFNDKMVRASEGTIFNMNTVVMDLTEAISIIKEKSIKVYYADMYGSVSLDDVKSNSYAFVLGSEGQGISDYIKKLADKGVNIPINQKCESLNVSVCGGIIMYKLRWEVWIMCISENLLILTALKVK